jgi:hypothetical protein
VCGRRGPTAREIWTTGRVVGSKQWGSGNDLRMKLLLKAEHLVQPFTRKPALLRATPLYTSLYMETSSSKNYPFTKDSTLCEQNLIAHWFYVRT